MESLHAEWEANGVVRLPQLLNEDMLQSCRRLFDDATFAPKVLQSRTVVKGEDGTKYYPNDATGHQGDHAAHRAFFAAHPEIAKTVAGVLGTENLWYCDHEIWYKTNFDGSYNKKTMLHQDTLQMPARGLHIANLWISFEPFTPAKNALAVVKGTHTGPHYQPAEGGVSERNLAPLPNAPRREGAEAPRVLEGPPVPPGVGLNGQDIAANREERKEAGALISTFPTVPAEFFDRLESYDLARGDVLMLHSHTLHGGAPLTADHPERHTIVLRVFGDDCVYRPAVPTLYRIPGVEEGTHLSRASPQYFKIWGPGAVTPAASASAPAPGPAARL